MSIFKAYDIRGKYPGELNEEMAFRIGYAVARFIDGEPIALGRDVRTSAPSIARAVAGGIAAAGKQVVDIGLATTPMLYFAVGHNRYAGGIIVTASHNPPEYIGMKICREEAIPIGEASGLQEIKRIAYAADVSKKIPETVAGPTKVVVDDYRRHVLGFIAERRPMKIVVDTANGVVGPYFLKVFGDLPCEFTSLYPEPDGRFPNHEPDPLKDKNIRTAAETIRAKGADLGVAFDGDGDRCIFIDEKGERITSDLVMALLARQLLSRKKGRAVVYDVRSSWVVREEVEKAGGVAIRDRVGHAFMKATMRKHNAIIGGELSGHFYFADNYFADSGMLAFAVFYDYLSSDGRKASEIVRELRRYAASGEINFHVEEKDAKIEEIASIYKEGRQDRIDGITVQFDDWWFNVRKSNTEPLLRLNVEAKTASLLAEKQAEVARHLGTPEN